jgi:cobaltochelatase CobS
MTTPAQKPSIENETPRVIGWEAFTIPGIDVPLRRCVTHNGKLRPAVPKKDPSYVFRTEHVRELATCVWPSDDGEWMPMLLTGPKGCGKTSLVLQVAAHCGIPVYRINLNVGTAVRHIKGRVGAVQGQTVFVPGVATLAMENGAWLLLDEVSGATPPVALSLFPILEPDGDVLLEDAQPPRYVNRHADFRVFATDNTIGAHMEASRFEYRGTNPDMNSALLDRFGGMAAIGYLDDASEHAAVASKVPAIDTFALQGLIICANNIRATVELPAFSTRMVLNWARRVAMGKLDGQNRQMLTGDYQLDTDWILACAAPAFLDKQRSMVEREAMAEIIRRQFTSNP